MTTVRIFFEKCGESAYISLLDLQRVFHRMLKMSSLKLGAGGADGHAHVRAGITVRNGENVQLIHAGALVGNVVGAGKNGVAQGLASNHGFVTPHIFWVKQSLVGNDVVHVDIDAGDL